MSDPGSVADEPVPADLGDTADEGCRHLASLAQSSPADDPESWFQPPSSVPESPLQLEVDYEQGFAAVTVRGPQIFVDKLTSCKSIWGGYGYRINWGDGTPEREFGPRDCTMDLRHEFHLAGTFEVRASTFHPGALDAPEFDSRHEARLVIDPARLPPSKPLGLSLVDENRTFRYQSGPSLQYTVQKNRAVQLCVELRSETGVIGNSDLIPIRHHVTAVLQPHEYFKFDERYQAALRAGQSKFYARAILFDESGKPLEHAVTESFQLTQL